MIDICVIIWELRAYWLPLLVVVPVLDRLIDKLLAALGK